ncbi:hypothetical protein [Microbacterium pumilum]|uniref:Uncharacterized protein n=1 Tax=Microbacterium pumilum TaxID=344165 RepID=A0ABN2RUI2_9MICO
MSGGEGFGPAGPVAAEGPPFSVAGPTTVSLDAARTGSGSFTVSNVTGRAVRARVLVLPGEGADASWFQVTGESERALPLAGTATVDVAIKVAEKAPAGSFSFAVGAALEEAPDQVVSGPTVVFQVPGATKRRFPWWIVIVAAVALLLLVGGGILIWNLTRPNPQPSPTDTGPAVLRSETFLFDTATRDVDLDLDGVTDIQLSDADLSPAVPAGRPTTVFGNMRGVAFIPAPTFEQCRDVFLQQFVEVPEADDGTFVCVFTSEGHAGVLEFGPTQPDQSREVKATVWE